VRDRREHDATKTPFGQPQLVINYVMIAADIFRPEQWTNFFLLVTLTGLVFVAMSLNLKAIAID